MSSLKIVELTEENTCNICNNGISKYSCPKCNIQYCSLACYQSEGHLECSENFYKDSVMEQLGATSDKDSKAKMMEILERFHAQNGIKDDDNSRNSDNVEDDDDDYSDLEETLDSDDELNSMYKSLEERLAGVCLDNSEDVWQTLNNDEKQEFEAFLMSGDVSQYIPMWTPWWEYVCDKRIIDLEELEAHKCKCPKILTDIKQFSQLTSKPPADCVQFNMMNILAAYVFIVRYFNGDHMDFPKESSSFIFNLSLNVRKNENFDCFNLAINSVIMECSRPELVIMTDEENIEHIKPDVQSILGGPHSTERKYYLMCALSEIHTIFEKAVTHESAAGASNGEFYKKFTEHQVTPLENVSNPDLKKVLKKIEYFLSYAKDSYEV